MRLFRGKNILQSPLECEKHEYDFPCLVHWLEKRAITPPCPRRGAQKRQNQGIGERCGLALSPKGGEGTAFIIRGVAARIMNVSNNEPSGFS